MGLNDSDRVKISLFFVLDFLHKLKGYFVIVVVP